VVEAKDESPTQRVVNGYQGSKYVVELRSNLIVIRPKGARRGGPTEVSITPSALHDKLLLAWSRRA
jgi:hypothetical protein